MPASSKRTTAKADATSETEEKVETKPITEERADATSETEEKVVDPSLKSVKVVADEVLSGAWGNNLELEDRLNDAGYDARDVLTEVYRRMGGGAPAAHKPDLYQVARLVAAGLWGEGNIRRQRLEGAGYNYQQVQAEVEHQQQ